MLKTLHVLHTPDLLHVLASMGHGDEIALVDRNFPAVSMAQRLVRLDGAHLPAALEACMQLLPLDTFVDKPALRKVFGGEYMKVVGDRVQSLLCEWGYMRKGTAALVLRTIFEVLLYKRSPHLDELKIEDLQAVIGEAPDRGEPLVDGTCR